MRWFRLAMSQLWEEVSEGGNTSIRKGSVVLALLVRMAY